MDLQDHERDKVVDHTQYHSEGGVHHLERPDAEQPQQAVDEAAVLEDTHPGVGAHHHIDPGGHGDHQYPEHIALFRALGNGIGDGIAHQHTDDGGDHRNEQRAPQHIQKDLVTEEPGKVIEGKANGSDIVAGGGEGIEHNHQHGGYDHHSDPRHIGVDHIAELFHRSRPLSSWT